MIIIIKKEKKKKSNNLRASFGRLNYFLSFILSNVNEIIGKFVVPLPQQVVPDQIFLFHRGIDDFFPPIRKQEKT